MTTEAGSGLGRAVGHPCASRAPYTSFLLVMAMATWPTVAVAPAADGDCMPVESPAGYSPCETRRDWTRTSTGLGHVMGSAITIDYI